MSIAMNETPFSPQDLDELKKYGQVRRLEDADRDDRHDADDDERGRKPPVLGIRHSHITGVALEQAASTLLRVRGPPIVSKDRIKIA